MLLIAVVLFLDCCLFYSIQWFIHVATHRVACYPIKIVNTTLHALTNTGDIYQGISGVALYH